MRRFARLPSRILAVSAATFIGALGAVAFAGPASAHDALVTSTVACVPGKPDVVKVSWKVENDYPLEAVLSNVKPEVGVVKNAAVLPAKGAGALEASQEVPMADGNAGLKMKVTWSNGVVRDAKGEARWKKLDCGTKPTATAVSNCDGTLTVKVKNTADTPKRFSVNGEGTFAERKNLKVGDEWTVVVPKGNAETVRVKFKDVPADENDNSDEGFEVLEKFNWTKPELCTVVTHEVTCDNLTIKVENTGSKPLTAVIKHGDSSDETTIEPGESDTATIPGVEGLVVTLTINNGTPQEFKWEKPADCGGGLPVTGVNAGLLAGAAFVLVGGGGGLFYMARRRRVTFAA